MPTSKVMLALFVTGAGAFWLGVAPGIVVRHWTADGDPAVQCRQTLVGQRQWSDPQIGRVRWTNDDGSNPIC